MIYTIMALLILTIIIYNKAVKKMNKLELIKKIKKLKSQLFLTLEDKEKILQLEKNLYYLYNIKID